MKIGIIGLGAAGMMAATTILDKITDRNQDELFLFEKNNKIGQKVLISGGGRCNVTTGLTDVGEVLTKYPRGAKFLKHAMHSFPPDKVFAWFEEQGVELKTEEDLRVFPKSDNGSEVVKIFEDKFKLSRGTQVHFNTQIQSISKSNGKFYVRDQKQQEYCLDAVVLTTGGQAFRHTGSTGDGYALAEKLGHSISKLGPSLNSFILKEDWVSEIAGISHRDVVFKVVNSQGKKLQFRGPCLWTHKGKTGPAIFAMSSLLAFEDFSRESQMNLVIDLYPELNQEQLKDQLLKFKKESPSKNFINSLSKVVPRRLAYILFKQAGLEVDVYSSKVSNKQIFKLVELIKNCQVSVIGRGKGDEFVTAGGVNTNEIDSKTMESKVCPGLFFAGELIDVDGFTGGFNLQASWATGRLAGEGVL